MACESRFLAFRRSDGQVVFCERGDIVGELRLACGRCVGCRLERARQWAVRCVHEASMHEHCSFITLTYAPEFLPDFGSLRYSDFQGFIKRLRQRFRAASGAVGIRFFMCGEYGDRLSRPHYHALLFGVRFADARRANSVRARSAVFRSSLLESCWPFGFSSCGEVNFRSSAYVARYTLKKVSGDAARDHYFGVDPRSGKLGPVVPEFSRMSLKPGIGAEWFRSHFGEVYPEGIVTLGDFRGKAPRYYDQLFARDDPEGFEELQYRRFLAGAAFSDSQSAEAEAGVAPGVVSRSVVFPRSLGADL